MEREAGTGKRQRLTEIVSGLGPDATPAQIREEAYRAGFGAVNGHMLIAVRNALWPGREKRTEGFRLDGGAKRRTVRGPGASAPCPECGSGRTRVIGVYCGKDERVNRRRCCGDCGHRWSRHDEGTCIRSKRSAEGAWANLTEKTCTYCGRNLPIEAFGLVRAGSSARRPGCKECGAEKRAGYIGADLVKRYRITLDDYHAMLRRQGGRCAICGTDQPFGPLERNDRKRKRRTFSVDHCHATGKVRGLLCARCNLAIGNFGDDTDVMRAAVAYLESHAQPPVASATIPEPE